VPVSWSPAAVQFGSVCVCHSSPLLGLLHHIPAAGGHAVQRLSTPAGHHGQIVPPHKLTLLNFAAGSHGIQWLGTLAGHHGQMADQVWLLFALSALQIL